MKWKSTTLFHTTAIGTHRIVRLPGTREEDFVRTLREVLATASLPDLNRVTNVEAQELQRDESGGVADSYLWVIYFRGLDRPELVRELGEAMYESVREKLDSVGVRTSFNLAVLEGRWEAES